ncbi:MAG: AAC(3) family N-acetyltransferase [Kordiimonadales bacterium]|nr:MAG: AAC(3) family N-acetyltransferase [Kordiimonadales bacterium]
MLGHFNSIASLKDSLRALGVHEGDGLFVHASMSAIGPTVGSARAVVEALLSAVGRTGLLAMPGFSTDAYFPPNIANEAMSRDVKTAIEDAVLGFDLEISPTFGMGVIAETFRTWPGTCRSVHPATSICLNGLDAPEFASRHSLAWATGPETPLGYLQARKHMKMLLIGVGWNRCSALHTAESLADTRRTKVRRFKTGTGNAPWMETPDVADDLDRLFPKVGAAYEEAGLVSSGKIGGATSKICDYAPLVSFAADWINNANIASGDKH